MIECCLSYACSDIDGSVITDQSIPKWRRYILFGSLIFIGLAIFIAFIFGLIYFIRLTPYYFFGKTKAKKIYFATLGFSIISIISIILYLVFLCKIFKRQKSRCLFLCFNFFSWISVALAFICYFWGAESVKNELTDNDPCSAPLSDCYDGIMEKFGEDYEYIEKFTKWYDNLNKDDICGKVIVPMILLEIIMFIFYLVFAGFIGGCCCCQPLGQVENDSEDQNQNENNKSASQDPNNPNMIPNQNNLYQYPVQNYPNQYSNQIAQPNDIKNVHPNDTEQNVYPLQTIQNLDINESKVNQ